MAKRSDNLKLSDCDVLLFHYGITDNNSWRKAVLKYHPDKAVANGMKYRDANDLFVRLRDCWNQNKPTSTADVKSVPTATTTPMASNASANASADAKDTKSTPASDSTTNRFYVKDQTVRDSKNPDVVQSLVMDEKWLNKKASEFAKAFEKESIWGYVWFRSKNRYVLQRVVPQITTFVVEGQTWSLSNTCVVNNAFWDQLLNRYPQRGGSYDVDGERLANDCERLAGVTTLPDRKDPNDPFYRKHFKADKPETKCRLILRARDKLTLDRLMKVQPGLRWNTDTKRYRYGYIIEPVLSYRLRSGTFEFSDDHICTLTDDQWNEMAKLYP